MAVFAKFDVNLPDHWKILEAGPQAELVHYRALMLAKRMLTDGRIHSRMLPRLGAKTATVSRLVQVGLWESDGDGYVIHDWDEWNDSACDVDAKRARVSGRAAQANHVRWHVKRGVKDPDCSLCRVQQGVPEGSNKDRTGESTETETEVETDTKDVDEAFDTFWDAYPKRNGKKLGKAKTLDKWRKMSAAKRDRALVAVVNYAAFCKRADQFPKDAERFLPDYFEEWVESSEPTVSYLSDIDEKFGRL